MRRLLLGVIFTMAVSLNLFAQDMELVISVTDMGGKSNDTTFKGHGKCNG